MDDSHLFFSGEAEKEVAVHQNGQSVKKEVAVCPLRCTATSFSG
jgi:hypothetical protein